MPSIVPPSKGSSHTIGSPVLELPSSSAVSVPSSSSSLVEPAEVLSSSSGLSSSCGSPSSPLVEPVMTPGPSPDESPHPNNTVELPTVI